MVYEKTGESNPCEFPVSGDFAFVLLMTPDINVNHKYIMISYAFLTIFWAWAVCSLWNGRNGQSGIQKTMGKILAIVLVISLSVTGIYDFVVIVREMVGQTCDCKYEQRADPMAGGESGEKRSFTYS